MVFIAHSYPYSFRNITISEFREENEGKKLKSSSEVRICFVARDWLVSIIVHASKDIKD